MPATTENNQGSFLGRISIRRNQVMSMDGNHDQELEDLELFQKQMKIGTVTPRELRAICEKGLLLVTIMIPEMEHILWPFLLRMIIPQTYTGAVAMVCRCISELWRHRSYGNDMLSECKTCPDIPTAEELLARLMVLLHDPLAREQLAT